MPTLEHPDLGLFGAPDAHYRSHKFSCAVLVEPLPRPRLRDSGEYTPMLWKQVSHKSRDTGPQDGLTTRDPRYASRLLTESGRWWKRLFDVQYPYRWNLRRLNPGFTLDIGCGLGRNLINLNGNGVGIDHNPYSVEIARSQGLRAFTPDEFQDSEFNIPEGFDSILLSHVAEHLGEKESTRLLMKYLRFLRRNGQVILITPQEYGYRTDPTHELFMDFASLRLASSCAGLVFVREFSFPFPRLFGRMFKYNEFISISRKP